MPVRNLPFSDHRTVPHLLALAALLLLLIGPRASGARTSSTSSTSSTVGLADGGALSGKVIFTGESPRRRAIRMDADPACAALHEGRVLADDVIIAEHGGLANVFVYVEVAPDGSFDDAVPTEPVQLRQEGCQYTPRVQGIRLRQTLEVLNVDPTLHNVRSLAKSNRPFNMSQPAQGKRTKFFTKQELPVKFKCDVHSWMSAYLFVIDHPFFATTDRNGHFSIDGLPDGRYTLVAWHEKFGQKTFEAQVGEDDQSLTIEYSE